MKNNDRFIGCPHCKKLLWSGYDIKNARKVVCPFCKRHFHYNGFSLLHFLWQLIVRDEPPFELMKGSFSVVSTKPELEEDMFDYEGESVDAYLGRGANYFDAQYAAADSIASHRQYMQECAKEYECKMKEWRKKVSDWNERHPDDSIDPDSSIYLN